MKNTILIFAALVALAGCAGNSNDSKKEAVQENKQKFDSTDLIADTKFAVTAADGSMMEVELGKLALTNGSAKIVKDFAQKMIDDHSQAGDELKNIAASKNITIPAALSNKNQNSYDDLAKKKGAAFDKAYASYMVDDHKEDIDEFKKEADQGKDPEIKNWAAGKVPVLQHHLMMAQAADSTVKNK